MTWHGPHRWAWCIIVSFGEWQSRQRGLLPRLRGLMRTRPVARLLQASAEATTDGGPVLALAIIGDQTVMLSCAV